MVHPERRALGAVFISHSSVDKPFVRRLDSRPRREGFDTWLDEKDMLIGDSLPHKVSSAVGKARAVIIVISQASTASTWVHYELRQAAQRMIDGQCRLVPVVIDDVEVPPELTGLLYADCRPGRRGGVSRVIQALDAEATRLSAVVATLESDNAPTRSRGIDRLVSEVFDGHGWASADVSATRTLDWEIAMISDDQTDVDVVVESVVNYGRTEGQLSEDDWDDWTNQVREEIGDRFGLLVSERAASPELRHRLDSVGESVFVERAPARLFSASGALVLIELAGELDDEVAKTRLLRAKEVLKEAAKHQEQAPIPPEAIRAAREGRS